MAAYQTGGLGGGRGECVCTCVGPRHKDPFLPTCVLHSLLGDRLSRVLHPCPLAVCGQVQSRNHINLPPFQGQ